MVPIVDDLLADQRRCWAKGEGKQVEEYLIEHPELVGDREGLIDLIYNEFVLRSTLNPETSAEKFFDRFPQYRNELQDQFTLLDTARERNATIVSEERDPPFVVDKNSDKNLPRLEGYEILAEVGRGSMGKVFKAWHRLLRRHVAIKVLLPERAHEAQACDRFQSEGEAMARLSHTHIVQVYDVGPSYFAMELVEGITLEKHIKSSPLPSRQAAKLIERLARAIHYAHKSGVIHRDLKPANILLQKSSTVSLEVDLDNPKITDFGLARQLEDRPDQLRETGIILGTPIYMAPEQIAAKGKNILPVVDVYALGTILYELLTGRPPFLSESAREVMRRVESEEPLPPSRLQPQLPRDLDTICLKCLEKAPERRYESAEALSDDLGRYLRGEVIVAGPSAHSVGVGAGAGAIEQFQDSWRH